jgi:uncharacterized MAPEG superfamily protein
LYNGTRRWQIVGLKSDLFQVEVSMIVAYWCVLIAGLLPYAATLIAKSKKGFDNANPRTWLAQQEGYRARAHAAQLNSFEAFPFFAAAVIIAQMRGAPPDTVNLLAIVFVAARVVFLALYVANLATLRTLAWLAGMACVVALFFV